MRLIARSIRLIVVPACWTLLFIPLGASAQFRKIHYEPTDNDVVKFDLYSQSEGYIAFQNYLGFTSDSGRTVLPFPISTANTDYGSFNVNLTFGFTITGVKALNKSNVIAYGGYANVPAILYSSDGGRHFKVVYHSQYNAVPNCLMYDIKFFSDGKTGYAIDNERILKTTDGGVTWAVSMVSPHLYSPALQILSDNSVLAFAHRENGEAYYVMQKNNVWQLGKLPYYINIQCGYFLNETTGWLNSIDGITYQTKDGGTSWLAQNQSEAVIFQAEKMIFVNDSTGYAIVANKDIYKTTNAGKLWERLMRDNTPDTDHPVTEMHILGKTIWAGGGHGYIELSSNEGGPTVPTAAFKIDTAAVSKTGITDLVNFSRSGYTYQWVLNGKQISDKYNASYQPNVYGSGDTIKLIVSNGKYRDTSTKTIFYDKGIVVYSFGPSEGRAGTMVTIEGKNFASATSVTFGGIPAQSFRRISNTTIEAYVGTGNSGPIKVMSSKSAGVSKARFTYLAAPVIDSFSPQIAKKGDTLTIKGKNFYYLRYVGVGTDFTGKYEALSDSVITIIVRNARSGSVYISNDFGAATKSGFKALPVIDSISPKFANYGSDVTVYGSALRDAVSITLDGNPVLSISDTLENDHIKVRIGEGSKGVIAVTTPNGSYAFNGLVYYQRPLITSFAPLSAPAGESVVISGSNFSDNVAENFVYFNKIKAVVTKATSNSLTVTVPGGVTYGPITVATHSSTIVSTAYFTPTFKNAQPLSAASFATTKSNVIASTHDFQIADIDYDNKPDLIVPRYGSGYSSGNYARTVMAGVYRNTSQSGVYSFTGKTLYFGSNYYSDNGAAGVAIVDRDQNGKLDFLIPCVFNADISLFAIDNYDVNSNITDFSSSYMIELLVHAASAPFNDRNFGVAVADLDADGQLDHISYAPYFSAYQNILPVDLDNDGRADALNISSKVLNVSKNKSIKGSILFASPISYDLGSNIKQIRPGDINGDGKMDITVSTAAGDLIALINNSDTNALSFTPVTLATGLAALNTHAVGDVDGDGKIDILVSTGDKVSIYKNTSAGAKIAVGSPIDLALKADLKVDVADMDDDGRPDIIGLSENNNGDGLISILKNINGAPLLTFSPAEGAAGASVEIKGDGFTGATSVKVGGVEAHSFVVNSPTSITANIGTAATGPIVVQTSAGYVVSSAQFVLVPKPLLTFYTPLVFETGGSVAFGISNRDPLFSYQWQKNGSDIPGETNVYYSATQSGTYTLVSKYKGISTVSDPLVVRTLFTLPSDNLKVSATSISCKGDANGSISIAAVKAMSYSAQITSALAGYSKSLKFDKNVSITGLSGGTYTVCITIDDHPEYSQCFSLTIAEPRDLSVYTTVIDSKITLDLSGGETYYVRLNDQLYTTKQNNITLQLLAGVNKVAIYTDKLCQGTIEKLVNFDEKLKPYPNPFASYLNVNLGDRPVSNAIVSISDIITGKRLLTNNYNGRSGIVVLNLADLRTGIYILNVNIDGKETIYKIFK